MSQRFFSVAFLMSLFLLGLVPMESEGGPFRRWRQSGRGGVTYVPAVRYTVPANSRYYFDSRYGSEAHYRGPNSSSGSRTSTRFNGEIWAKWVPISRRYVGRRITGNLITDYYQTTYERVTYYDVRYDRKDERYECNIDGCMYRWCSKSKRWFKTEDAVGTQYKNSGGWEYKPHYNQKQ